MSIPRPLAAYLLLGLALVSLRAGAADWHEDFASRTVTAYKAVTPMPLLSAEHPDATLADGYAIQGLVVKQLLEGKKPGGFKAAVVAAPGQKAMGIDSPLAGVIPPKGVLCACEAVMVDLREDPARNLETEVGYIVGKAISAPVPDIATLQKYIKNVVASIEVPGGPVDTSHPPKPADIVAWNINSKIFIVGEYESPETIDEDAVAITLKRDGQVVNTGLGSDAAGGQWETLLKTVNTLVGLGYTIEPDQLISNGALGKIIKAEPGAYLGDFGPLGQITFEVLPVK